MKIQTYVLLTLDAIDQAIIAVDVYGNIKVLSDEGLPEIPYNRIRRSLQEANVFVENGIKRQGIEVNIMVVPRELQRGERKSGSTSQDRTAKTEQAINR